MASALLITCLSCSLSQQDATRSYGNRFAAYDRQVDEPLVVPVSPPAGYVLFDALDARTWVPTGFDNGRVPTVVLCSIEADLDPAGSCYGTDDADRVVVDESVIDGHRLVIVATSGDGFAAQDMMDDWQGQSFTTEWQDLGWLDEASTTGRWMAIGPRH